MSKSQFRNLIREVGTLLLVCLIVLIIYGLWLIAIGIPKTQARNLYNQAHSQIKDGSISTGVKLLEDAFQTWPEEYIGDELQLIHSLNLGSQE